MFCSKCGASLTGQEAFCPNCGTVVLNKQQGQPAQNAQPQYQQTQQQYQQPNQQYQQPNQQYQQANQQYQQSAPNAGYMPNYGTPQAGVNPNTWDEIKRNNCIYNENGVTMGIGWLKFIVYFQLFASAVLSLINGIVFMSGALYGPQRERVYQIFPSLQPMDVCMGIYSIIMAALCIVARFQLTGLKKTGPTMYYIIYISNVVLSLIYVFVVYGGILGELTAVPSSTFTSIASSVAFFVINIQYFGKRKIVFKN